MNQIATHENHALAAPRGMGFDLSPQTFEQAMTFANMLADSELVPKDFKGKPGNCLIAMQWGSELGLKPLQALSNIAVVNGRAALWGDAVIALVRGSSLCEYVRETDDGHTATCRVKRKGEAEHVTTFSMDDAKQAGLAGKQGPWTQYPKRMRQIRARAFNLRDVFPDVLRGMPVAEEIQDYHDRPAERSMGAAEVVQPGAYPQAEFDLNLDKWAKVVASGRKTMDGLIAFVSTKGALSQEQQAALAAAVQKLQANTVDAAPAPAEAQATPDAAPPAAGPAFTFAQVADGLHKAKDLDALFTSGDLIGEVAEQQHRAELIAIFDDRQRALGG